MLDKVLFVKDKEIGEITAIFPYEVYNKDAHLMVCYAHVGQHGCCQDNWIIKDTVPASEEEYYDLLKELISIGYNPKILKKYPKKSYNYRWKKW